MNKTLILGLDIGGANSKAALIIFKDKKIQNSFSYITHFPFWKKTIAEIPEMLRRIISNLITKNGHTLKQIDYLSVTITAELSDAFKTKREGILTILNALKQVFPEKRLVFISYESKFLNIEEVEIDPLKIASANWISTALFLGQYEPNCILIDGGSTTIDVIPIQYSIPIAKGYNDITRLQNKELIYSGGLRATIPSITHFVPYKGNLVRISFEKFALISDVHRILNNISEKDYINDPADNRSKSLNDCYARLSRMICMDLESISKEDLDLIAKFIYKKQLNIILREIKEFMDVLLNRFPEFEKEPKFVVTGLAGDFLIRKALQELGYDNILSYEKITQIPDHISSSAFAVAGAFYFQL